jgi:hypothetical protein
MGSASDDRDRRDVFNAATARLRRSSPGHQDRSEELVPEAAGIVAVDGPGWLVAGSSPVEPGLERGKSGILLMACGGEFTIFPTKRTAHERR